MGLDPANLPNSPPNKPVLITAGRRKAQNSLCSGSAAVPEEDQSIHPPLLSFPFIPLPGFHHEGTYPDLFLRSLPAPVAIETGYF